MHTSNNFSRNYLKIPQYCKKLKSIGFVAIIFLLMFQTVVLFFMNIFWYFVWFYLVYIYIISVFCSLTIFAKWPNEIPNNSKHDMTTEMFIIIISKKMHNERKSDLKLVIRCTNVDCGHLLFVSCLNYWREMKTHN